MKRKGEHFLQTKTINRSPSFRRPPGLAEQQGRKWRGALARLPRDPGFVDDLEKVNEADQTAGNPWA